MTDIAIDRDSLLAESDGGERPRRIGPDARQLPQLRFRRRKLSAMPGDHRLGAGVEIARPRVIAEPRPLLHHRLDRGGGQSRNIRPAAAKGLEIRLHRRDCRLLQHDLGQPDEIGIGQFARPGAPGQIAALAVIPVKQRPCRAPRCLRPLAQGLIHAQPVSAPHSVRHPNRI